MKLSKPNKDKLIGGVIAICILFLTLYIKECFEKHKPKTEPQSVENVTLTDSSSQIFIQPEQNNDNNGNVSNEYILGDKIVSVPDKKILPLTQTPSNQKSKPKEPPIYIEKNDGNVNTGDVQGDLTQTVVTKPPPRQLTQLELDRILNSIPKGYNVVVFYQMPEKEPENFANQIVSA